MALNADFFVKMPVSQKLLILLAIIILIVLGYWFFVDNKMVRELKNLREGDPVNPALPSVASLTNDLEKLKWVERDKKHLEQQIEEKKHLLKELEKQLPTETEMERLLLDLSEEGKAGGITFIDIKPQSKRDAPGGLYQEVPLALKFRGSYKFVMTFFSKVTEMKRIINFENIGITSAAEMGKGTKGKSTEVEITCTAVTYQVK